MCSRAQVPYNVLQLPVVGVWNTQLSMPTNGCLKIQNFVFTRLRQLLVGAVGGVLFFRLFFSFQ
jgi:hypothetical protein